GRYGTTEGVGPDAEPPRHITRFTYRMDGIGFYADRPQHLFVIDVPVQDDPTAPAPVAGTARAADDDAAGDGKDSDGADRDDGGGPAGARAGVPVQPVQVTSGERDHRDPVWDHDGTHLLAIRAVIDELRGDVVRLPVRAAGADADAAAAAAAAA